MPSFVALLRAINVGDRQVSKATLVSIFEAAGCREVETYIQSGNVVFGHGRAAGLTAKLESALIASTGFAVPVVVRTADEWESAVVRNPFAVADPKHVHVAFLAEPPEPRVMAAFDVAKYAPEDVVVLDREIYLLLPNGMGRARLPAALPLMKRATARNWATVTRLHEMLRARAR